MKIRKAKPRDFKKIAEILKIEFSKKPYNEKWTEKSALKKIKEYSKKDNDIYVAILNNQIVGFVVIYKEVWHYGPRGIIEKIAIYKKFWGIGVGKALFQKIEKDYKKKGVHEICLWTKKNAPSYKFYKKINYVEKKNIIVFKKKLKK